MISKRNLWIRPVIVGIIIFPLSLFMDVLMSRELSYGYAFVLAIVVGLTFFVLEYLINYRINIGKLSAD
jgi:hypothetical protein